MIGIFNASLRLKCIYDTMENYLSDLDNSFFVDDY